MSDVSGYAVCDFCGHEMFMPCRTREDSTACRQREHRLIADLKDETPSDQARAELKTQERRSVRQ